MIENLDILQAPPSTTLPTGSILLDKAVETQFSSVTDDDMKYQVFYVLKCFDFLCLVDIIVMVHVIITRF